MTEEEMNELVYALGGPVKSVPPEKAAKAWEEFKAEFPGCTVYDHGREVYVYSTYMEGFDDPALPRHLSIAVKWSDEGREGDVMSEYNPDMKATLIDFG